MQYSVQSLVHMTAQMRKRIRVLHDQVRSRQLHGQAEAEQYPPEHACNMPSEAGCTHTFISNTRERLS